MFRIFSTGRKSPQVIPSDTVVPLGLFDDNYVLRHVPILCTMYVVDAVLDPSKLTSSLETLVEKPGWRKLGARLRRNVSGRLEYHIPSKYTADRPAIRSSFVAHNVSKAAHALRLPERGPYPTISIEPDEMRSIMGIHSCPKTLDDYLYTDIPLLGLHIVKLTDATMITISWPHVLFDVMALGDLLKNWIMVLEGKDSEIATPHGGDGDPLAELGLHPGEPYCLVKHAMSTFSIIAHWVLTCFDSLFSKKQHRMIYVPGSYLKSLRETAMRELRAGDQGHDNLFLSDGDILCAWWARLSNAHLGNDPNRQVALVNALSLRTALSTTLLPGERPVIVNAVGLVFALMRVRDIICRPLSDVACRIRRAITEHSNYSQVEAFAAIWRNTWNQLPPLFGDYRMHLIVYSNWTKAKLYDLDFSSAVVGQRSPGKTHQPCYIQNYIAGFEALEYVIILGKGNDGGYWMNCSTNEARWPDIEAMIAAGSVGGDAHEEA